MKRLLALRLVGLVIVFLLLGFHLTFTGDFFFSQKDERWKGEKLGFSDLTIGSHGCAITSIAMVFKYYGVDIDPKKLNTLLKSRKEGKGFIGAIVQWEYAADFTNGKVQWIKSYDWKKISADLDVINSELDKGYPVIVETRWNRDEDWQHFVVLIGRKGSAYYMYDPMDLQPTTVTFNDRYGDPKRWIYGARIYHGTPPPPSGEELGPQVWVAPGGDDANPGSQSLPFATIQKGIDEVPEGGTVIVLKGTYKENLTVSKSVKIKGIDEVIIQAATKHEPVIRSTADLMIENITLMKGKEGIVASGESKLLLNNCIIRQNYSTGIYLYDVEATISNCQITENGRSGIYAEGGKEFEGITPVNLKVSNSLISNNYEAGLLLMTTGDRFANVTAEVIGSTIAGNGEGAVRLELLHPGMREREEGKLVLIMHNNTVRDSPEESIEFAVLGDYTFYCGCFREECWNIEIKGSNNTVEGLIEEDCRLPEGFLSTRPSEPTEPIKLPELGELPKLGFWEWVLVIAIIIIGILVGAIGGG